MTHAASTIPPDQLLSDLESAVASGRVTKSTDGDLALYCYSRETVYSGDWDAVTKLARGIVMNTTDPRIVAMVFPKFFNSGESHAGDIPIEPFETMEKLDGSMVAVWHYNGKWNASTKGSFDSDQAIWAQAWLDSHDLTALIPGETYIFELIGPSNRIVVRYERDELVLLGAYRADGTELIFSQLQGISRALGLPCAQRWGYGSLEDVLAETEKMDSQREGFVLRFVSGYRLKVKSNEYRRVHGIVSRLSPLTVWEAMMNGGDLASIRNELPDELQGDFDDMQSVLCRQIDTLIEAVRPHAELRTPWTDKEVGLDLKNIPDPIRGFIFPWRKTSGNLLGDEKARLQLFRHIRPTGNVLHGYTPSFALNKTQEELIG